MKRYIVILTALMLTVSGSFSSCTGKLEDPAEIIDQEPEEEADEETDEETELSVEAVKRELNRLPDGYRIVLSMRLFDECEFEEIAQALQIKESTVRSHFARGREKLVQGLKLKV